MADVTRDTQQFFLSVIVPIKNMESRLLPIEKWLKHASLENIEVVFVNDNSEDATLKKLREIKEVNSYDFIRILNGNFGGPGPARNHGLIYANAKWIAFWDSDDYPHVARFVAMLRNAEAREKPIAIGAWEEKKVGVKDKSKGKKIFKPNFFETVLNPGIWRWAFRESEIRKVCFPDSLMGEDQVFLTRLNVRWCLVHKEKKIVYDYIKGSPGQLTKNQNTYKNQIHFKFLMNERKSDGRKSSLFSVGLRIKVNLRMRRYRNEIKA